MASIEALPTEILCQLLICLPQVSTLEAAVEASPILYACYLSDQRRILIQILRTQISENGAGLDNALGAVWSLHSDQFDRVIDLYWPATQTPDLESLSIEECFQLLELEKASDILIESFCQAAQLSFLELASIQRLRYTKKEFGLTPSEEIRLRRSFYRWHTFCNLARTEHTTSNSMDTCDERSMTFLQRFPKTELEELYSWEAYAHREYHKLFDGNQIRCRRESLGTKVALASGLSDSCTRSDNLVMASPLRLCHLLQVANIEERYQTLVGYNSNFKRSCGLSISCALYFNCQDDRDNSSFPRPLSCWFSMRYDHLRRVGYHIWDKERLRHNGIFDSHLLPSVSLCQLLHDYLTHKGIC
jgi:hypothetical protein